MFSVRLVSDGSRHVEAAMNHNREIVNRLLSTPAGASSVRELLQERRQFWADSLERNKDCGNDRVITDRIARVAAFDEALALLAAPPAPPQEQEQEDESRVDANADSNDSPTAASNEAPCPRCGMDDPHDVIAGRCWDCRLAEEECEALDEDEDDGGSPWGR